MRLQAHEGLFAPPSLRTNPRRSAASFMSVPVMEVRIVRMMMPQRLVAVLMGMRFCAIPAKGVRVPVMIIVPMAVSMFERLMGVFVLVAFAEV
jgi:hypothetical protein